MRHGSFGPLPQLDEATRRPARRQARHGDHPDARAVPTWNILSNVAPSVNVMVQKCDTSYYRTA